ncbi:MAG: hypothetical protein WBK56_09835 [Methanoculleus sp.]
MTVPLTSMDDLVKTLNAQTNNLRALTRSIKKLMAEEADILKRLDTLHREIPAVERQSQRLRLEQPLIDEIAGALNTWREETGELESRAKAAFGEELEQLLAAHGHSLEGNYPKLKTSFYTIVVDIRSNRVTLYYGPEAERIAATPALPEDVCNEILKHETSLADRVLDEDAFLADLFEAYSVCLHRSNKRIGAEVPIPEIFSTFAFITQDTRFVKNPVRANYHGGDRATFSYDLYSLKERTTGSYEMVTITARRGETRSRYDTLWIPGSPGRGTGELISGIKFREATK